ncbi:MAG: DUF3530 family protein [Hahellaceae bacterium]|nr:DUF3530 family protein [Hahellaceae bacterium]
MKHWLSLCLALGLLPGLVRAEDPAPAEEAGNAAPAPAKTPRQAAFDEERFAAGTARNRMNWLASDTDPREVIWLNGDGSSSASFLALYLPNNTKSSEGGMLILPDLAQHPDWPGLPGMLRHGMPDHGWHTLSLQLKSDAQTMGVERVMSTVGATDFPYPGAVNREGRGKTGATAGPASAGESGNSEAAPTPAPPDPDPRAATNAETDQLEQQMAADANLTDPAAEAPAAVSPDTPGSPPAEDDSPGNVSRIEQGLAQLDQFGLLNQALLGVGTGARATLAYLEGRSSLPEKGFAFVWVNAVVDENDLRALKEKQPLFDKARILDVVNTLDLDAVEQAELRQKFARRNKMEGYRQLAIPMPQLYPAVMNEPLLLRIKGWLKKTVPGQERG